MFFCRYPIVVVGDVNPFKINVTRWLLIFIRKDTKENVFVACLASSRGVVPAQENKLVSHPVFDLVEFLSENLIGSLKLEISIDGVGCFF